MDGRRMRVLHPPAGVVFAKVPWGQTEVDTNWEHLRGCGIEAPMLEAEITKVREKKLWL